jgi:hypothetical protein
MTRKPITFSTTLTVSKPADYVFAEITNWGSHSSWIPATTITVHKENPDEFTAWTGIGPIKLEDRMRVTNKTASVTGGECTLEKLGPAITGSAIVRVTAINDNQCRIEWDETVYVPYTPSFVAAALGVLPKALFTVSLKRFRKSMNG